MIKRKCELSRENFKELEHLYFIPLMNKNNQIEREIESIEELKKFVNSEFNDGRENRQKVSGYNAASKMIVDALKEYKFEMDKMIVSLMMEVADDATFRKVLKI